MITDNKYSIDDFVKDQLLKKHENKPVRMIRQVLEDGTVVIGKNRYDALKKIPKDKRLKVNKVRLKYLKNTTA